MSLADTLRPQEFAAIPAEALAGADFALAREEVALALRDPDTSDDLYHTAVSDYVTALHEFYFQPGHSLGAKEVPHMITSELSLVAKEDVLTEKDIEQRFQAVCVASVISLRREVPAGIIERAFWQTMLDTLDQHRPLFTGAE